jgi:hypothetical protein
MWQRARAGGFLTLKIRKAELIRARGGRTLSNKPAPNSSPEETNNARPENAKQGITNHDLQEEDERQKKVIPFPAERQHGRGREGRDESSREEE